MSKYPFFEEASYARAMHAQAWPALRAVREEARFQTCDGTSLFVVRYPAAAPRGSVVILHGLGESAEKYRELCYYFWQQGLSVLIFEQRGHARSTRYAARNLIHADCFDCYVQDFAELMEHEACRLPEPRYLFAHSMGGAVSALYLSRGGHFFQKAVLSSPIIAMQYKKVPRVAGYALCATLGVLGCNKRRFFGTTKAPAPHEERLELSGACSAARFAYQCEIKAQDPLLWAARPTFGWTREALGCTRDILKKGVPERIEIPVRVYAAEHEVLVLAAPQREFAARVPKGVFQTVCGAKHEIYFSKDDVLHPYLAEIMAFFLEEA